MLRGSGISWDLRKVYEYDYAYFDLNFIVPVGLVQQVTVMICFLIRL